MTDGYHIDINKVGSGRFSVSEHGLINGTSYFFGNYVNALNKARKLANDYGFWIHDYVDGNPRIR